MWTLFAPLAVLYIGGWIIAIKQIKSDEQGWGDFGINWLAINLMIIIALAIVMAIIGIETILGFN